MARLVFAADSECLHPHKEFSDISDLSLFVSYSLCTSSLLTHKQRCQHTHTFNKTCAFPKFTSTSMLSAMSNSTFFCFSHMILFGQPDLIKDSPTVYMHQITLHALCSTAMDVTLQYPSPLLFSFLFPPFPTSHDIKQLHLSATYHILLFHPLQTFLYILIPLFMQFVFR